MGTLQLLNMGQKWIPTPCHDTPVCRVQQQVTRFARNVRLRAQFGNSNAPKYHVPNPAYQPPPASPAVEAFLADISTAINDCYAARARVMRARPIHSNVSPVLSEAIARLRQLRDIIIKPADKNMGMVVLDREWYQGECNRILGDASTYLELPPDQLPAVIQKLQAQLQHLCERWKHALPETVYKYLLASASTPVQVPALYLLPKVHKLPAVTREHLHLLKGRPIAACHSWVTTAASVYLADVLNAACASKYPQVLPDSTTLVRLLESSVVSADAFLVTFDVENMYPSIDNDAAIDACTRAVTTHDRGMIEALLTFVMKNGYCENAGRLYQQVSGTVMGTNVAPPYANIYVASELEAKAKALSTYWPAIYKRFIDDGFFIWEQDEASLLQFLRLLNTLAPSLKLSWVISKESVAYMDLQVTKVVQADGATARLQLSTYQKPHNRYLYIPFNSFHRPSVFKGFVKAELLRYAVTNTTAACFERMKSMFYGRLKDRGYPAHVLDGWFAAVQHSDRVRLLNKQPVDLAAGPQQSVPPVLVLPNGQFEMNASIARVVNAVYASHKQHEAVASVFGQQDKITVAFYKNQTLGARFIRARD